MSLKNLSVAVAMTLGGIGAQSASAAPLLTGKPATCFGMPATFDGLALNANAPKKGVYEVPNDGIEDYMPVGSPAQGLPETIQGIWWMDGNPGGLLVTLGNATYDAATRTARLPASTPGSYALRPTPVAGCLQSAMAEKEMGFIIRFSEDFKHATLNNYTADENGVVKENTSGFARFTMDLEEEGHWVRHSYLFNITIPDYQLRRIVNGDGTRDLFNYDTYLEYAGPTALLASPGSVL